MAVAAWFRRWFDDRAERPRDTVLVCAPDSLFPLACESALRSAGFDVLRTTTVEDGIVSHWQHHRRIALVVLSLPMPGLSNRQLVAGLRAADPDMRCCVVAADREEVEGESGVDVATPTEMVERILPLARLSSQRPHPALAGRSSMAA